VKYPRFVKVPYAFFGEPALDIFVVVAPNWLLPLPLNFGQAESAQMPSFQNSIDNWA
jgi:hypothetical protein